MVNKRRIELQVLLVALFLIAIGVLAYLPLASITGHVPGEGEVKQRVIVVLKDGVAPKNLVTTTAMKSSIRNAKAQVLADVNGYGAIGPSSIAVEDDLELETVPAMIVEATDEGIEQLEEHPLVEQVIVDFPLSLSLMHSVPLINADFVRNSTVGGTPLNGTGVAICYVDTGIQNDHPAFAGRIVNQKCFCQGCCEGGANEGNLAADTHSQSHGTHVAGIFGGSGSIKGAAPGVDIVAVKVCSNDCLLSDVLAGMDYCVANKDTYNIKVMSASIGDNANYQTQGACPTYLDTPINAAYNAGILTTIASGNNGYTTGISYPACSANAVAVGATNDADAIPSWSNRGSLLELLAPGDNIYSTVRTSTYGYLSGTSMATPHVAGAAAIIYQYAQLTNMNVTPAQVLAALQNSSTIVGSWPRLDLNTSLLSVGWQHTTLGVDILSPSAGPQSAENVLLLANVSGNMSNYSISWSSNIAGSLASQNNVAVNLSIGNHTITCTANDGRSASDSVLVRALPTTVCSVDLDRNGDGLVDVGDLVVLAQMTNLSCIAPSSIACLAEMSNATVTDAAIQEHLNNVVNRNVTDVYGSSCAVEE